MKSTIHFFLISLLLVTGCRSTSHLKVVDNFDIKRYLGTWYEAARYPHRFEKGLTQVTAQYTQNPNGTIKVVNRGFNASSKEWKEAVGEARFKDDPTEGWLKVSFFKPFYASYKILYLDDQYSQAIITGPTYNYLWILVRDREIPDNDLTQLINRTHQLGFETNKLEIIDQSLAQSSY